MAENNTIQKDHKAFGQIRKKEGVKKNYAAPQVGVSFGGSTLGGGFR